MGSHCALSWQPETGLPCQHSFGFIVSAYALELIHASGDCISASNAVLLPNLTKLLQIRFTSTWFQHAVSAESNSGRWTGLLSPRSQYTVCFRLQSVNLQLCDFEAPLPAACVLYNVKATCVLLILSLQPEMKTG